MIDRDKVIAALQHCATLKTCDKCPMGEMCKGHCNAAMAAAVELLKGQEAVKTCKTLSGTGMWYQDCGACGGGLPRWAKYCPTCGRAVKWDD